MIVTVTFDTASIFDSLPPRLHKHPLALESGSHLETFDRYFAGKISAREVCEILDITIPQFHEYTSGIFSVILTGSYAGRITTADKEITPAPDAPCEISATAAAHIRQLTEGDDWTRRLLRPLRFFRQTLADLERARSRDDEYGARQAIEKMRRGW